MADVDKLNVGGVAYNVCDTTARASIPTKTSNLTNDSGFVVGGNTYSSPLMKIRSGKCAFVVGTFPNRNVAVTNQYVANVAYYADVTLSIPSGVRLSSIYSVSVQTINGLGLLAVDILEQEVDHIKVRLYSPKSETITLGFSVFMSGAN